MSNLVVTGHRPERIPDERGTRAMIGETLKQLQPALVYQGMAAGVDLWTAVEAWRLNIPFHSVRPWAKHKPAVPQNAIDWVLRNSAHVDVVIDQNTYPGPWAYEARNRWMIDRADLMLAVWDGKPRGGTYNAVKYAQSKGMPIHRIDPVTNELSS